jgi:hypothetical protein
MAKVVVIGVAAAAVLAGAIWWMRGQGTSPAPQRARGQRPMAGEEGRVVVLAFGRDWARRFDCTEDELSGALITGANATLAKRVGQEAGLVDLRYDASAGGAKVAVTLMVTYASTMERSTARLDLPWDDVPRGVRADLLRGTGTAVFRKWKAD